MERPYDLSQTRGQGVGADVEPSHTAREEVAGDGDVSLSGVTLRVGRLWAGLGRRRADSNGR
jgi:hypothetical protein